MVWHWPITSASSARTSRSSMLLGFLRTHWPNVVTSRSPGRWSTNPIGTSNSPHRGTRRWPAAPARHQQSWTPEDTGVYKVYACDVAQSYLFSWPLAVPDQLVL